MSIEAYGNSRNADIMRARVESVYRYFTMRGHEIVPVRYAYNPIHCSCHGDTVELIRYEVPTDRQVYNCADLPSSRKQLNGDIPLEGAVLVTFRHNPIECIGGGGGCFLPAQDSNIRAYYTQLILKKGSIYSVENTRDSCPPPVQLSIEEHLDYQQLLEKYFLVPHPRNIILPVGYVVLRSSFNRAPDECTALTDSIFIRFPVTEEQLESRLRVYAKKYTAKGVEFKPLVTKKIKGGPVLMIQGALNPTQFDTIFIAKRITEDEVNQYLFPADSPTEQGAIASPSKAKKDTSNLSVWTVTVSTSSANCSEICSASSTRRRKPSTPRAATCSAMTETKKSNKHFYYGLFTDRCDESHHSRSPAHENVGRKNCHAHRIRLFHGQAA